MKIKHLQELKCLYSRQDNISISKLDPKLSPQTVSQKVILDNGGVLIHAGKAQWISNPSP